MEDQEIISNLEKCLRDVYSSNGRDYLISEFANLNLEEKLDKIQLYDFEVKVEEVFFDSEDSIPDGILKTIPEYIDFIKKNLE